MSISESVARRLQGLRKSRGWTAAQLAEEMTRAGIPWDRQVVSKLENGRRQVITADELAALSLVLDIALVHLVVPTDAIPDDQCWITPTTWATPAEARAWIRGQQPLAGMDARRYGSQVPPDEFPAPSAFERLAAESRTRMQAEADRLGISYEQYVRQYTTPIKDVP